MPIRPRSLSLSGTKRKGAGLGRNLGIYELAPKVATLRADRAIHRPFAAVRGGQRRHIPTGRMARSAPGRRNDTLVPKLTTPPILRLPRQAHCALRASDQLLSFPRHVHDELVVALLVEIGRQGVLEIRVRLANALRLLESP
jgi:hypothetical protein